LRLICNFVTYPLSRIPGWRDPGAHNRVQFTAPVSNGSSGGPVLDEDGNVIGIADWILRPDGNEIAENLNFAHGVSLMQTAMNSAKSNPAYVWQPNMPKDHKELNPPVLPAEPARRKWGQYELVEVKGDTFTNVSDVLYAYLTKSASVNNAYELAPYLMEHLSKWFNLKDVTGMQAIANDNGYFKKWPVRHNYPDMNKVTVEQVIWSGDTCYLVALPYEWSVENSRTQKSGKTIAVAFVTPGKHRNNGQSDYFIAALWNEN
jgi:Trypsin-like peptidase domain